MYVDGKGTVFPVRLKVGGESFGKRYQKKVLKKMRWT